MIIKKIRLILLFALLVVTHETFSQVLSLAGKWDFRLDSVKTFSAIKLPGSCEEQGYGSKSTVKDPNRLTRETRYVGKAWYRKNIEVPESWNGSDYSVAKLVFYFSKAGCHFSYFRKTSTA